VNRDIFEAIKTGKKRVETRAATVRFVAIQPGDTIRMVCGKDIFEKQVKNTAIFKTIPDMLKAYALKDVNPFANSIEDLEKMYYGFPGYREKLKKHGLVALTFK